MTIALFGNDTQDRFMPAVIAFVRSLANHDGIKLIAEENFLRYIKDFDPAIIASVSVITRPERFIADIAVSFGGDGTFLTAAQRVADEGIPLMGINTGHLGYLSSGGIDEAEKLASDILAGEYTIERRARLKVEVDGIDLSIYPRALNEIAILKKDSASMITIPTTINGLQLADYQADGLLISTPTGSTAYNLSAGGPIIDPEAGVWVLSPIAPHSLTMRPLVVNDRSVIAMAPASSTGSFRLSVDGRSESIPAGSIVRVKRASHDLLFAHPRSHNFISTLRNKLLWGR